MTFKHIHFDDSVTMRSLARVAKEKGWLKESMTSTASSNEPDYTVTENLTVNIMKLCSGLREQGFEKYANEVEEKFLNYKRAASLYDTSKEKGEDLVDAAHPEGSHKLEGVEGDNVVETIIDQQLEHLKVVNKKPTGKLSSKQILNQVKTVLAQQGPNAAAPYMTTILGALNSIARLYHNEGVLTRPLFGSPDDLIEFVSTHQENASQDDLAQVYVEAGKLYHNYKPNLLGGGVSEAAWSQMEPYFSKIWDAHKSAQRALQEPVKPVDNTPQAVRDTIKLFNDTQKIVTRYTALIEAQEPDNKAQLLAYLNSMKQYLSSELDKYNKLSAEDKVETSKIYSDKLMNGALPGLNAFKAKYVNG